MTLKSWYLFGALALIVIVAALFVFRFALVAIPAGGEGAYGHAYRLDRWTGDVVLVHGRNWVPVDRKVEERKPSAEGNKPNFVD